MPATQATETFLLAPRALRAIPQGEPIRTNLTAQDRARVIDLIKRYADLGLGTVDASIVAIAERLAIDEIATLNRRDFAIVRPSHAPAFELIP